MHPNARGQDNDWRKQFPGLPFRDLKEYIKHETKCFIPRRELKIRRAAEYFRRGVSSGDETLCRMLDNFFLNKTILGVEIKDAKMSSFSSDF